MHTISPFVRFLLPLFTVLVGALAQAPSKIEPTAHPFLWRIEGDKPSWVYGTIHLPDRRVTTLPQPVVQALDSADMLLTEIELDAKARGAAQKASLLPRGTKLADVLPAALHARLAEFAASKRFPAEGLEPMKPWVVMTMLPMLDDLKSMLSGTALDAKLVQEAKERDIETGALETLDEQLGVFEAFSNAEQAKMLSATLTLLEQAEATGRKPLEEMVQAYLSGDLDRLSEMMDEMTGLEEDADLHARLEKALVVDRNHNMAERILVKLRAEPKRSYFFAVGALHHAGDEGVVALLRAQGLELTRIGAPAKVEARPKKTEPKKPEKTQPENTRPTAEPAGTRRDR